MDLLNLHHCSPRRRQKLEGAKAARARRLSVCKKPPHKLKNPASAYRLGAVDNEQKHDLSKSPKWQVYVKALAPQDLLCKCAASHRAKHRGRHMGCRETRLRKVGCFMGGARKGIKEKASTRGPMAPD
jgi:hypothetical protein